MAILFYRDKSETNKPIN